MPATRNAKTAAGNFSPAHAGGFRPDSVRDADCATVVQAIFCSPWAKARISRRGTASLPWTFRDRARFALEVFRRRNIGLRITGLHGLFHSIVRSFARDHDVMHVRFAQAGSGDAYKPALLA